mmetsp:Transcript_38161/g.59566  ORF Transcript_38161/g.59566 Transcript_38161/m.59566 type:complete len:220 (-) Transcript_38161:561-1220(-)
MEEFHALPHSPSLTRALGLVFGQKPFMHPRHIGRVHFPSQHYHRTLPHQDYPYVQGTRNTLTCWCPLGDVPATMGPLAILVGSHKLGQQKLIKAGADADAPWMTDLTPFRGICEWATADFEAGDVLMFRSFTVHMALDNDMDEVRLSLDCRAQPEAEPVSARALKPNWDRQTWPEIYSASKWNDPSLQYYWKNVDLDVVEEENFDQMAFHSVYDPVEFN